MTLRILYVCTGNVCRSPTAELLLRRSLGPDRDVSVSSAGTQAFAGRGTDRSTALALDLLGVDAGHHVARQFEPAMAVSADLVLTAERIHRDIVMARAPTAFRRTFTMKEFARLATETYAGDPRSAIAVVAASRGLVGVVEEILDDVPDPYGRDLDRAMTTVEQIATTVRRTVDALGLDGRRRPSDHVTLSIPKPRPAPRPSPGGARRPSPRPRRPDPTCEGTGG